MEKKGPLVKYRSVLWRAMKQTGRIAIAHSWSDWLIKVILTGGGLFAVYLYTLVTKADDSNLFGDSATVALLSLLVASGLVLLVFLGQLLFLAPYQLWKEEHQRAEEAEAALVPVTQADRTASFHEALTALKRVANARELWWAANHRREGPSPLGDRPLEAIDRIRQFFPPEVHGSYKEDQISRLYNAAISYGRELGYERGETERLKSCRENFEKEIKGTIQLFEELNGAQESPQDKLYKEELARERASVKAKADMMRERLSSRNHSVPGASDAKLAAWWEAELRGEAYDETHRSTMKKTSPLDQRAVERSAFEMRKMTGGIGDQVAMGARLMEEDEKRAAKKAEDKRRRALVAKGRDLAQKYALAAQEDGYEETFRQFLERQRIYADIRPHLSAGYLKKLEAVRMTYADGEGIYPTLVRWFLDDLERLEKEWGLI